MTNEPAQVAAKDRTEFEIRLNAYNENIEIAERVNSRLETVLQKLRGSRLEEDKAESVGQGISNGGLMYEFGDKNEHMRRLVFDLEKQMNELEELV